MTYLIGFVVAAVVGLLLVWSGLWFALPILVIAFVLYMVREMREGMASYERGKGPEPTGTPRSSSGTSGPASSDGATANERVGQT